MYVVYIQFRELSGRIDAERLPARCPVGVAASVSRRADGIFRVEGLFFFARVEISISPAVEARASRVVVRAGGILIERWFFIEVDCVVGLRRNVLAVVFRVFGEIWFYGCRDA